LGAISHVFTITYVAEMLGEDEDWLHELSIDMFPEDGRLYVECGKDDAVTAFTEDGIENLKQIIADPGRGTCAAFAPTATDSSTAGSISRRSMRFEAIWRSRSDGPARA